MRVLKSRILNQEFLPCVAAEVLFIKVLKLPDIMKEGLVHDERDLNINDTSYKYRPRN